MSLRFTDPEKWADPWFRKLPPWGKLLWLYACDHCDITGFLKVDREMVTFKIGVEIPWGEVGCQFDGHIRELTAEKWLLPKFVSFQFKGKFDPASKDNYVKGVLNQLARNGLHISDLSFQASPFEGGSKGPTGPLGLGHPLGRGSGEVRVSNARAQMLAKLQGLGVVATEATVTEWSKLAQERASCRSVEEALDFVAWSVKRGLRDGANVQYSKHAAIYADEWRTRQREAG